MSSLHDDLTANTPHMSGGVNKYNKDNRQDTSTQNPPDTSTGPPPLKGGTERHNVDGESDINQTGTFISAQRNAGYTNVQLDEAYLDQKGLHFHTADRKIYEQQVAQEKANAKQNLIDRRGITKDDVFKSNWWSDHPDPYGAPITTPYQVWDSNYGPSIEARWMWDTQRYISEDASRYASWVLAGNTILKQEELVQEFANTPITTIDMWKYNTSGSPSSPGPHEGRQLTPEESALWQSNWDAAYAQATQDVAMQIPVTKAGYDTKKWSSNPDIYYNDLKKTPWALETARVYWITGRFTKDQAYKYLTKGQFNSPNKKDYQTQCEIEPWNGKYEDLPRYIIDYIKCSFEDGIEEIKTFIGKVADYVYYGAIVALILLGWFAWNERAAIKSATLTSADIAANLIPGRQYYKLKQQVAKSQGISTKQAIYQDIGQATNPIGLIKKVTNEYTTQNPNSLTAQIVPSITASKLADIVPDID